MKDFLKALARRLECNTTAYKNYRRIYVPEGLPLQYESDEGLRVNILFKHIQNLLSSNTTVIAEAGHSWFNCQKLKLPRGCGYEYDHINDIMPFIYAGICECNVNVELESATEL